MWSIFRLTRKNESTLFVLATHSKKRPHNLVLGRMFDNRLLDMVELGIDDYSSLNDFKNEKIGTGVKPCLIFNGPAWEQSKDLERLKNLFIDMFNREKVCMELIYNYKCLVMNFCTS